MTYAVAEPCIDQGPLVRRGLPVDSSTRLTSEPGFATSGNLHQRPMHGLQCASSEGCAVDAELSGKTSSPMVEQLAGMRRRLLRRSDSNP